MTEKDLENQELRRKLEAYEDTGLTPEELREMDGEPVRYELKDGRYGYGIIHIEEFGKALYVHTACGSILIENYGKPNDILGPQCFRCQLRKA